MFFTEVQAKLFLQVGAAANCNSKIRKVSRVLSSVQVYQDEDMEF